MAKKEEAQLSRRERQIMEIVYRKGNATAAEVHAEMADRPSYSRWRALLRVLEERGSCGTGRTAPANVFSPTVPRDRARRSALQRVVGTFFAGGERRRRRPARPRLGPPRRRRAGAPLHARRRGQQKGSDMNDANLVRLVLESLLRLGVKGAAAGALAAPPTWRCAPQPGRAHLLLSSALPRGAGATGGRSPAGGVENTVAGDGGAAGGADGRRGRSASRARGVDRRSRRRRGATAGDRDACRRRRGLEGRRRRSTAYPARWIRGRSAVGNDGDAQASRARDAAPRDDAEVWNPSPRDDALAAPSLL